MQQNYLKKNTQVKGGYHRDKKSIDYKVKNGKLLRIDFVLKENEIKDIKITGDFFIYPEEGILFIEDCLRDCNLNDCKKSLKNLLKKQNKIN